MASETKNLEQDIQALRADVAALADSIGRIVSGAADAKTAAQNGLGEGLDGAARAGRDFLSDAARLKSHSADVAGETAGDAASALAGEIKRNPFMAVAAALFVGFIVGTARRR